MALTRNHTYPSPNYSGRGGTPVDLGVIHSSEGATTGQSLGGFFMGDVGVSSHYGIDNANDNTVWVYVGRKYGAWTQAYYNSKAWSVELCCPSGASANWSREKWLNQEHMMRKLAALVAEEAKHFGLPIDALTSSQAQGSAEGECEHKNLGANGGGHVDCGPNFPIDEIIRLAKGGETTAPTEGIDPMMCVLVNPFNGNVEAWELNPGSGNLFLRYQTPDGRWSESIPKGGGFEGSPSAVIQDDKIQVFVQAKKGAPVVFVLTRDNQTWVKQNL